jgi:aminoglycoside phosphotransferase (APT) family kinase protein
MSTADTRPATVATVPFDVEMLRRWLRDMGLWSGPVALRRIGDGHSNLTYAITGDQRTLVLRRPPPPPLPPGANDMLREARILSALADTDVPVPRVLAVAEPGEIMDVPCYVMQHLDGVIGADVLPEGLDRPAQRKAVAEAFLDVLVAIHAIDWRSADLRDLGRPDGFLERQLERLPRLVADRDGSLPGPFGEIRDRLRATMPTSDDAALLHGDFRLGNVMIAPHPPARVLGVLDWELAGIGDPLADLAYTLATYAVPDEPLHALTALSTTTRQEGFPSRDALTRRYAEATGRDISRLPWYEAVQLFKLAVLFEYNRRKTHTDAGADPFYSDPTLVEGLLDACRRAHSRDSHPAG